MFHLGLTKATFGDKFEWLVITKVELITFGALSLTHAMMAGHDSVGEYKAELQKFYEDIHDDSELTFIRFEKLEAR